jgi:hypothetical protein
MIEARFRHRAGADETIADRHSSVISCLTTVSWLWERAPSELSIESEGESAACDLTPFLKVGMKGAISYSARYASGMTDKAMFDDVLTLEIDEQAVDYREFSTDVFGQVASCFSCYRASIIHDLDLDLDDYDQVVEISQSSGIDADGRDSVFRINPVNYFDEEMCQRAFRLGAGEVVDRLQDHVELVDCKSDGVLIVVTGDLVDRDNLKGVHDHVAGLLGIDSEVPA